MQADGQTKCCPRSSVLPCNGSNRGNRKTQGKKMHIVEEYNSFIELTIVGILASSRRQIFVHDIVAYHALAPNPENIKKSIQDDVII